MLWLHTAHRHQRSLSCSSSRSEGVIWEWWGLSYLLYVAGTADLNNRRAGEDLYEPLMWKKETVLSGNIICMQIAAWMERINTDYAWWREYYTLLPHWPHQSFSQKNRHQRSPDSSNLCCLEHAELKIKNLNYLNIYFISFEHTLVIVKCIFHMEKLNMAI